MNIFLKTLFLICLMAAFVCSGCSMGTAGIHTEDGRKTEIDDYGCRIERYSIHSPSMDKMVNIAVVLPPGYDSSDADYPVIYTLHGGRAPYDTYANMPRFRSMLGQMPMIYTCFEAELSAYLDWPNDPKIRYTTFFFDEFIPHIEATYRTNGQRGVTGFSMGGTGSMYYMLKKPEMFKGVCSVSTGFRKSATPEAASSRRGLRYGDFESNKEFYKSIDTFDRIAELFKAGTKLPPIMLRCGTEDGAVKGLRVFRDHLCELNQAKRKEIYDLLEGENGAKKSRKVDDIIAEVGIDFVYVESPGRHAWPYWHGQAKEVARFFWEVFQKDLKAKAKSD